jgi:hypothetical protein
MPAYVNSPFTPAPLLIEGVPNYLFGSKNYRQANTRINISSITSSTASAIVTGTIVEGEIPLVGALVSIQQTASQSGAFNVSRAALTGSAFTATTGQGSLTFSGTFSTQSATADAGTSIVEVPEIPETLVAGASIAICIQQPRSGGQRTITTEVSFPTMPTAATVVLQEAVTNEDGNFTTVSSTTVPNGVVAAVESGAYTTGPVAQFTLTQGNFYRFLVSGITGTGTIAAKIL